MERARRNTILKRICKDLFNCKVSVRQDRGTASGWVQVYIAKSPNSVEQRRAYEALIWAAMDEAKISDTVGTYGYDDPGSDYGFGRTISIRWDEIPTTEDGKYVYFDPDRMAKELAEFERQDRAEIKREGYHIN